MTLLTGKVSGYKPLIIIAKNSIVGAFHHSLEKHMVGRHYYNFRYLKNMLKIRSRGFDGAQYCNVNQISKQIGNSLAKITNS